MAWKKVRKNIWQKKPLTLEIFQDTSWKNNNANVIVYDLTVKSWESSFGKKILVKYYDTKAEALRFARAYMVRN